MPEQPWEFGTAVQRCQDSARRQEEAEQAVKDAWRDLAEKEERYRKQLAIMIVQLHDRDGKAWSVVGDIARGQPNIAELKRERDIAEGVVQAVEHAAWRRNADRKDAQRFADWSQRRELAEGYGQVPESADGPTLGHRA